MTTAVANTGTSASNAANLIAGQQNLATSYNTFLSLLTTQLQNQDPTSPLDSNQFTQQLTQMTGVQQQLLSNQLLQQLVTNSGGGGGVSQAVGLIGKTVTSTADDAVLTNGQADWSYTLPSGAASATLEVKNAAGSTVWSGAAGDLTAGAHAFTWNGKTSDGRQLADGGDYTLSVSAKDTASGDLATTVGRKGVVSSVSTDSTGAVVLNLGAGSVPLTTVSQVSGA